MAWLIDGNKLKEKAVTLLFPTRMEPNGGLATEAVTVGEIEEMLYREGVEVVLCKECRHSDWAGNSPYCLLHGCYMDENGYCSDGVRCDSK